MLRRRFSVILVSIALAALPVAAEVLFPEFLEEAGPAIGAADQSCPVAESTPWTESGQFSTCAAVDSDFKQFKKLWRRLLLDSPSFQIAPRENWNRLASGIRTNLFRYYGFPGNVYFDEEQALVFFTVHATLSPCPGPNPMFPGKDETVYRVGSPGVIKPEKAISVDPRFPRSLRKVRTGGAVILRSIIDPSGVPTRLCVLQSNPDNQDMKDSAMEAVQRWRYDPALKDDTPVPFYLTIQVNFALQ
ncbi:MAG: energy transducer TonB [Acidobacteria bacterium]|uniref:Energy transducer TonB n=1 Tax=Candidatus Polarisedimenticola svalbardensis TaxID=2886004 RepID=A0A8J7CDU6_9BACT|nr:energy transducer TonB [Candidatus Polarisedimenticola svalbardensis]